MMHRNLIDIIEDKKLNSSDAKCLALKKFLENNAEPALEIVNTKDETALTVATRLGDVTCLALLIAAKANIHHLTSHEITPLMTAAIYAQVDCLMLLLKKGASINAQDIHGHTALDLALESRNKLHTELMSHSTTENLKAELKKANNCVRILLAVGAKPSWVNRTSQKYMDDLTLVLKNFDQSDTCTKQAGQQLHRLKYQQKILVSQVQPIKISHKKSLFTTFCLFHHDEQTPLDSKQGYKVAVNVNVKLI